MHYWMVDKNADGFKVTKTNDRIKTKDHQVVAWVFAAGEILTDKELDTLLYGGTIWDTDGRILGEGDYIFTGCDHVRKVFRVGGHRFPQLKG